MATLIQVFKKSVDENRVDFQDHTCLIPRRHSIIPHSGFQLAIIGTFSGDTSPRLFTLSMHTFVKNFTFGACGGVLIMKKNQFLFIFPPSFHEAAKYPLSLFLVLIVFVLH